MGKKRDAVYIQTNEELDTMRMARALVGMRAKIEAWYAEDPSRREAAREYWKQINGLSDEEAQP